MISSSERLLLALLLFLASSSRAFVVHPSSSTAFVSTASTSFRLAAADAKNASEVSHDNVEDYRNQMGILRDRDAGEDATPHVRTVGQRADRRFSRLFSWRRTWMSS